LLLVGDDWAEDHHDVEVQDETGRRLGRARLPEGIAGITQLHGLIGRFLLEDAAPEQVVVGIETDRGGWVAALVAAGYQVFAVNPLQVARYRQRHVTSGAKSDSGDAHTLADMVRTDRHQLRPIAADSALAEAVKVLARAYQTLIWDRSRQVLRLRAALLEFFPAALQAFDDLAAPDALELLAAAPDPTSAAGLQPSKIMAALKGAGRHRVADKAAELQARLGADHLALPSVVVDAYAATVQATVAVIGTLNAQLETLEAQVGPILVSTRTLRSTAASPGWGRSSPPGCWASSVTPPTATPLCGRARTTPPPARSPASRQAKARVGTLRAQQPARRRAAPAGIQRAASICRSTRLLQRTARPRCRPSCGAAPARQPPGRHPPRLSEDPHLL
jgi:transposase